MKTRLVTCLCPLAIMFGTLANAQTVEVPLPELNGLYTLYEFQRTAVFELPCQPAAITGASIRISGHATVGAVVCEWGGPYPWSMMMDATIPDTTTGADWLATSQTPEEPGTFEMTAVFGDLYGQDPSWDSLLGGVGEVTLRAAPLGIVGLCWEVSPPPEATVTSAVLVVDGDFPIPVQPRTCGKIKALYAGDE